MKSYFFLFLSFFLVSCKPINIEIKLLPFINVENPQNVPCIFISMLFEKDIKNTLKGDFNPVSIQSDTRQTLKQVLPKNIPDTLIESYTQNWIQFLDHLKKYNEAPLLQKGQWEQTFKESYKDLLKVSKDLNLHCMYEESYSHFLETGQWDIPLFDSIKKNNHLLVYGAKKVMSTVYQSCNAIKRPTISMEDTLNIKGVAISEKHNQGGWRRKIVNKDQLIDSHYYLKNRNSPLCHNLTVSPLIYDFGGKPSFYSNPLPTLDFFTNQGSGSHHLGMDCSGFVFSALAGSGLRLVPYEPLQVSHVLDIGAANFKTPIDFPCLEVIKPTHLYPFKEGDIIASSNHIVIVDSINNEDPFQLKSITDIEACKNLKVKDFNFVVIQSSPVLGINRMNIKELEQEKYYSSFSKGVEKMAQFLCLKKLGVKGKKFSEISIIRHKQTEECKESEVYLKHQECLKHCWF